MIANGGKLISPTLIKNNTNKDFKRIISEETSEKMNIILRKVVTEKHGTASLANIYGYEVGGKTGTSQHYGKKIKILTLLFLYSPQNIQNMFY